MERLGDRLCAGPLGADSWPRARWWMRIAVVLVTGAVGCWGVNGESAPEPQVPKEVPVVSNPVSPSAPKKRTTLDLSGRNLSDDQIRGLAAGPEFSGSVGQLLLDGNALTAAGLEAVAASGISHLDRLSLANNKIGDDGAALVTSELDFVTARTLDLSGNGITAKGVRALFGPPRKVKAWGVNLSRNPIGDEGARAIADSELASDLSVLNLAGTGLTDAGASALATSPHLKRVTDLDVSGNALTPSGLDALRKGLTPGCRIVPGP